MSETVPMPYFPANAAKSLQLLCAFLNADEIQKFSDLKKVMTNRKHFDNLVCADLPDIFNDWNFLFEFFIAPNKKRWVEMIKTPPFPSDVNEVENSPAFLELKAALDGKLKDFRALYCVGESNDFSRTLLYLKAFELICRAVSRADELGIQNTSDLAKFADDTPRVRALIREELAQTLPALPDEMLKFLYMSFFTVTNFCCYGENKASWEDIIQKRYFPRDPAELLR